MKVSICMCTYNHGSFIAQAIDSVLMQRTNFEYELIIAEDCSTDNTRDIVVNYQKKYPEKIRLLLNENNLGGYRNSVQTLQAASGEYIAILEGDDYWTSPYKLQKQVDFLESHREYSLCFHNVIWIHEAQTEGRRFHFSTPMRLTYTIEDIAPINFIPTPSVMFRSECLDKFPLSWYSKMPMGDWPLWVLCAQRGKLGCIDEVMAAYRIHAGGVWSSQSRLTNIDNSILASTIMQRELALRFPMITEQIEAWRKEAINLLTNSSDYDRAKYHAKRLLTLRHFAVTRDRKSLIKLIIEVCAPSVYRFLKHVRDIFRHFRVRPNV